MSHRGGGGSVPLAYLVYELIYSIVYTGAIFPV